MTGHGQPESGTNIGPAPFGERTLRENFFPPFERAVRELNAGAVMPSYNEIDGVPSHANRWMLNDVLREEWGFRGVIVSDYFAIREMMTRHRMFANLEDAAVAAINAGVDVETPDGEAYLLLPELVREGRVTEAQIDAAVRRILRMKFDAGLFENPYVDAAAADGLTATPDAVALAREAAGRAMVLLRNEGNVLPLDASRIRRMAVLGTHARDTPIGGYSDVPRHVVSVLEGLQEEARGRFEVDYAEGVRITEQRIWAQDAVNLVARGGQPAADRRGGRDRPSRRRHRHGARRQRADQPRGLGRQPSRRPRVAGPDRPAGGSRPRRSSRSASRPSSSCSTAARSRSTISPAMRPPCSRAGISARRPATASPTCCSAGSIRAASCRCRSRATSASCRSSTTASRPPGAAICSTATSRSTRSASASATRRFDISAPRLASATIGTGANVRVEVDVANTGQRAGDEVVQLYVRDDAASVTRPVLELKRFQRVTLRPGERRTLSFELTPADLSLWNMQMRRVVEPGTFTISAGSNSVDLESTTLTVR